MDITRRKFFFFGLAAGIGLMLPSPEIKLNDDELYLYDNSWKTLEELKKINRGIPAALYGIPYHQNNGTTGIWLGFARSVR